MTGGKPCASRRQPFKDLAANRANRPRLSRKVRVGNVAIQARVWARERLFSHKQTFKLHTHRSRLCSAGNDPYCTRRAPVDQDLRWRRPSRTADCRQSGAVAQIGRNELTKLSLFICWRYVDFTSNSGRESTCPEVIVPGVVGERQFSITDRLISVLMSHSIHIYLSAPENMPLYPSLLFSRRIPIGTHFVPVGRLSLYILQDDTRNLHPRTG